MKSSDFGAPESQKPGSGTSFFDSKQTGFKLGENQQGSTFKSAAFQAPNSGFSSMPSLSKEQQPNTTPSFSFSAKPSSEQPPSFSFPPKPSTTEQPPSFSSAAKTPAQPSSSNAAPSPSFSIKPTTQQQQQQAPPANTPLSSQTKPPSTNFAMQETSSTEKNPSSSAPEKFEPSAKPSFTFNAPPPNTFMHAGTDTKQANLQPTTSNAAAPPSSSTENSFQNSWQMPSSSKPPPLNASKDTPLSAPTATPQAVSTTDLLASVKNKPLKDHINDWTSQIEQDKDNFIKQALLVSGWDKKVNENGQKILLLKQNVDLVYAAQSELDQNLELIHSQQRELNSMLSTLESQVEQWSSVQDLSPQDREREKGYKLAEDINIQLDRMSVKLKELVNKLNSAQERDLESDHPIAQIVQILNSHLNSLQCIDQVSAALNVKLLSLSKPS